jgi:dTDP-4-amino-4,6-dideoxygalactose transaminase
MSEPRLEVLPPLAPSVYARRRAALPFPLNDPRCRLYARARHGLWQALRLSPMGDGDVVLAPAYHHGSEIEALQAAGLECRFYEATDSLEPDESELEGLLDERVRALHLTHFLGFPQPATRWRGWCDDRGLALIEDAAQAWFASIDGRPAGSFGHVAIFCVYKTFGFPDGGAVLSDWTPSPPANPGEWRIRALAGRHRAWLAQRWPRVAPSTRRLAAAQWDPDASFALGDPDLAASRATAGLLRRVVDPAAAQQRRANYAFLLERLEDFVPPPFRKLGDDAAPFAFPILAAAPKERLLETLLQAGIAALDLWGTAHASLEPGAFPGADRRRAQTVGLPVHQELRPTDLERMAAAVAAQRALCADWATAATAP